MTQGAHSRWRGRRQPGPARRWWKSSWSPCLQGERGKRMRRLGDSTRRARGSECGLVPGDKDRWTERVQEEIAGKETSRLREQAGFCLGGNAGRGGHRRERERGSIDMGEGAASFHMAAPVTATDTLGLLALEAKRGWLASCSCVLGAFLTVTLVGPGPRHLTPAVCGKDAMERIGLSRRVPTSFYIRAAQGRWPCIGCLSTTVNLRA